ncbi:hypothetical protein SEA_BIG4_106 [Microbacterium phage Big4]|nr:hypothetical protein SEA_BIG4_106 [Microbacterium phage Big4]
MDEPLETPVDLPDPELSYLREVSIESHELFKELKKAGFSVKEALFVVGQMVVDALDSRYDEDWETEFTQSYDDEDDADDDGDSGI